MEKLEIPTSFILTAPISKVINLIAQALMILTISCGGELPTGLEESSTDNTERFTFTGFDGGTFFETWLTGGSVLEPTGFHSRELDSDIPVIDLTDLAAYWKMDTSPINDGMTVQDLTGTFDGILDTSEGALDKSIQGSVNSALELDGIDDYIDLGAGSSIAQNVSSLTMLAWIYLKEMPAAGECATIFYFSRNGNQYEARAGLHVNENGEITAFGRSEDTSVEPQSCSTDETIIPGHWFHIVGIIDYESNLIEVHVNGHQLAIESVTFANTSTPNTTSDASFLGGVVGGVNFFFGRIDDVSVFHRRLTATEISKIYEEQLPEAAGYFESKMFDAEKPISWDTISWVPESPSFKELPGGAKTETDYSNGGISSAGNVLLMHMNETLWNGVTGEVLDASGRGNHGTSTGDATTSPSGKFLRTGEFDGDDDAMTFPSEEMSKTTISAWIYRSGKHGHPYTVILYTPGIRLLINQTDFHGHGVTLLSKWSSTHGVWKSNGDVLSLHKWFHIAATYDSSSTVNVPLIYINGTNITLVDQTPAGTPLSCAGTGYIGNIWLPGWGFQGYIDEVAIWNRILSEDEIEDLFKRGSNRIRFQVRSCGDLTCSATPDFIGPDGTTGTYYSELLNTSISLPSISLMNILNRRYFQYRAYLDHHSWALESAALTDVEIKGSWTR